MMNQRTRATNQFYDKIRLCFVFVVWTPVHRHSLKEGKVSLGRSFDLSNVPWKLSDGDGVNSETITHSLILSTSALFQAFLCPRADMKIINSPANCISFFFLFFSATQRNKKRFVSPINVMETIGFKFFSNCDSTTINFTSKTKEKDESNGSSNRFTRMFAKLNEWKIDDVMTELLARCEVSEFREILGITAELFRTFLL